MSKNVIVTGGAGYIGSHVCRQLHQAGYTPITVDNLSSGHRHNVRWGPLVVGNINDESLVRSVVLSHSPLGVIHLAGSAYVNESMVSPFMYYENNFVNSSLFLKALLEEGIDKIVFSSTCATYGLPDTIPISETDPQKPINPYGWSKLLVEQLLESISQIASFNYMILRYFNAAGCASDLSVGEEHEPEPHLVPNAVNSAISGTAFTINGSDYPTHDGTAVRDFVHVEDLARAHVKAFEHVRKNKQNLALNLGTGKGISVQEVVTTLYDLGYKLNVVYGDKRAGDPPELIANPAKAKQILGWSSERNFTDVINSEILWKLHSNQKAIEDIDDESTAVG